MDPLTQFVTAHPLLTAVGGYVATAVVGTMPARGSKWNWDTAYGWFFDCAHVLLNQHPSRPTLPASPGPGN